MKILPVDLRYAIRARLMRPGMLLIEVGTLSAGLSLISLTIGVAHLLVGPPAFRDAVHVVGLTAADARARASGFHEVSYPAWREYTSQKEWFADSAAFGRLMTVVSTADGRGSVAVGEATAGSFFELFRADAARGRLLTAADDAPQGPGALVLSDNAWRRLFAADPGIVGTTLRLGSVPYTVVGVAPASFTGVFRGVIPDFWIRIEAHAAASPRYRREIDQPRDANVWAVARLRPGVTLAEARSAVFALSERRATSQPDARNARRLTLIASHELPVHPAMSTPLFRAIAGVLLGQVILLGLVTAANFATLTSMRAMSKYGEMVVRLSLGATSRRILTLLAAENSLVVVAALAVSLVVTWGVGLVVSAVRLPLPIQVGLSVGLDPFGILLTAGVAALIAFVVSIACTFDLWAVALARGLRETATAAGSGGAGRKQARLRQALVVAEVALSVVLIGLAAQAVRGLGLARAIDVGFDPHGVTVASLSPALAGHPPARSAELLDQVVAEVRQLAGVQLVTTVQPLPLSLNARVTRLRAPADAQTARDALPLIATAVVSPDYFALLRIPMIAGREFAAGDDLSASKVAIVNESLANRLWPDQQALGQTVTAGFPEPEPLLVIGVVRDSKLHTLGDESKPAVYMPARQHPASAAGFTLLARGTGDPRQLEAQIVAIVRGLAPDVPVFAVQPMSEQIGVAFTLPRFALQFFSVSAAIAIVFTALGLYGVLALAMTLRTREIGIRIAVGADRRSIVGLALGSAVKFGLLGIVPGALALTIVGPLMASVLYGIRTVDAITIGASIVAILALCVAAAYGPAHRVSRLNPMVTLRYQ